MRLLQWGLGLALLGVLVARARVAVGPRPAGPPPEAPRAELPDLGPAPGFRLVDQDGRTVTRKDLDGKPWIGAFIFTSCGGQCPMMTAQMKKLSGRLPGLRFVSFSVDPGDSPADLKRFAANYGAGWTFLTGRGDAVKRLSREGFKLAAAEGGPAVEPILHSNRLVLVDKDARVRGYFDSSDPAQRDRLVEAAGSL